MARFAVEGTTMKRDEETPRASATSASVRSSYAEPWDWMLSVSASSCFRERAIRAVYPPFRQSIRIHARSFVALSSGMPAALPKGESNGGRDESEDRERSFVCARVAVADSSAGRACDTRGRGGGYPRYPALPPLDNELSDLTGNVTGACERDNSISARSRRENPPSLRPSWAGCCSLVTATLLLTLRPPLPA